jgi:hypothetical protein
MLVRRFKASICQRPNCLRPGDFGEAPAAPIFADTRRLSADRFQIGVRLGCDHCSKFHKLSTPSGPLIPPPAFGMIIVRHLAGRQIGQQRLEAMHGKAILGQPRSSASSWRPSNVAPAPPQDAFTVIRSLPHGHVAAAVATARKIGLEGILGPDGNRCRDLALAMLISRILDPVSKLATARALSPATASSSLGEALGLGEVDDNALYATLDWLLVRQPAIETILAKRHLTNGMLVIRRLVELHGRTLRARAWRCARRRQARFAPLRWPSAMPDALRLDAVESPERGVGRVILLSGMPPTIRHPNRHPAGRSGYSVVIPGEERGMRRGGPPPENVCSRFLSLLQISLGKSSG